MTGTIQLIEPGSFIVDFSWNNVWQTPEVLVNEGAVGVCRYHSFDASKNLGGIGPIGSEAQRDNEIQMLANAGLGDIPNWEANTGGPLGGYSAGVRHGRECYRQMKIAEILEGTPCVASYDFDVQPDQYGICREYQRGFNEQIPGYDPWAYGHDKLITHLYEEGYIVGGWQCQAWSYGRRSPYTNILQFARVPRIPNTDDNISVLKESKMWFPGGIPEPPKPGGVIMAGHICFALAVPPDPREYVEIVSRLSDGRHRYRRFGNFPGENGTFYAIHPNRQGVNEIGSAELDAMGEYDEVDDMKNMGRMLQISGGGSSGLSVSGQFNGTIS